MDHDRLLVCGVAPLGIGTVGIGVIVTRFDGGTPLLFA